HRAERLPSFDALTDTDPVGAIFQMQIAGQRSVVVAHPYLVPATGPAHRRADLLDPSGADGADGGEARHVDALVVTGCPVAIAGLERLARPERRRDVRLRSGAVRPEEAGHVSAPEPGSRELD